MPSPGKGSVGSLDYTKEERQVLMLKYVDSFNVFWSTMVTIKNVLFLEDS